MQKQRGTSPTLMIMFLLLKKIVVSRFQISTIGKHFPIRIRSTAPASRQRTTF